MAGFDNAIMYAIEHGFGGLFGGAAISGLISIETAAAVTAPALVTNPITLIFTFAAIGYGFFKGRRKDRKEDADEEAAASK
ncbi:MAG: hypothetical protein QXH07_07095 [Thermoplasmata archaeon]